MAITKYKVIKKNLDAVINYAMNGEKTENGILVSAINCMPKTAYFQMMLTKKAFHKEDGRLGYHIIQSFNGNEITPDKCNKIGMELAHQLCGDKYQVIACTHTNKKNIHNHIVLNSVSFIDGSKYHNSNVEIALLRQTNDDICRKHGLSIIKSTKANTVSDISNSRIANYNRNSGKMELIKNDIDEAIKDATKYQEFIDILAFKGYYIKKSNNVISVSSPYYNRNIRLARAFGEDYTFDNIKTRIYQPTLYDRYLKRTNNEKIYKVRIYDGVKIDREKLRQLYKKTINEIDKTIIQAEINIITEDINKINSKIQTCKRIISKSEKGEKEDWLIHKRFQNNKERSQKENAKNKDKKRIR